MKKIILITVLACFTFFVFAQENENTEAKIITVEDAVNLALENNLSIKQSKMDLEILALKDKYSWNSVSPSFDLSARGNGGVSGDSDKSTSSGGWSISGGVSLNFSPNLAASIQAAKLAYEAGEMSLESAKRNVELSVRKTFYSLVYFNENLETQLQSLETIKQTYEANVKKYNQGRLSELDLLSSQYNYEKQLPTIENLKQTYKSNLESFKRTLGFDVNEQITLSGKLDDCMTAEIDEAKLNQLLEANLDNLPAIQSLRLSIETRENSLKGTKFSASIPSVSLSISDSISQNGSTITNKKTDTKIEQKGKVGNSLSGSISVRIPIDGYLPWSSTKINLASMDVEIAKLYQNLENTKIESEISIRNTYEKIKQAKTQLDLYEKNVKLMQKTYDMTQKAYNMGSSDLLSLQNASSNLSQSKYNITNQKYTIISYILDLENGLGIPFGTLNQNNKTAN